MTRNRVLCIFVAVLVAQLWPKATSLHGQTPDNSLRDLAAFAFVDLNGDGAYGLTETGMEPVLPGITISLYRDLPQIGFHGPEDILLQSAATNQDGYAVFRGLFSGSYLLVSALADGNLPTTPLEQAVLVDGNSQGAVLEFLFGQLARSAFRYRFIFVLAGVR